MLSLHLVLQYPGSEHEMPFRPDRLKEMREKRGLSQEELGHLIHSNQAQISRYELGGRKNPLSSMVEKMANALECSTDYLMGRTAIPESSVAELTPYEQNMVAWSRGQGRALTDEDFLAYRLEHHPENPKLKGSRQTPKE